MSTRIYIVEMFLTAGWKPTVGARLSRDDGRRELADWRKRNPGSKFRLARYVHDGVVAGEGEH
jgi:hypothetical protein